MRKKSQLQMMETIAILFIFFILVFIGFIFYLRMAKSGTAEKVEQFRELSRMQIAQIASSLPELQCSNDNIQIKNCVDIYKMRNAKTSFDKYPSYYFDLFAYSSILIEVIPIDGQTAESYSLYSKYPGGDEWSKLTNYFPISIYDSKDELFKFGVMTVEVYV